MYSEANKGQEAISKYNAGDRLSMNTGPVK
jgi:hypothetical protein